MPLRSIRLCRYKRLHSAAANSPPMKLDEVGEAVEALQQALIDIGFKMPVSTRKSGLSDGIYGKETTAAIKAFQTREQLQQDGVAGRDTLGRLDEIMTLLQAGDHAKFQADLQLPRPMRKYDGS